MCRGPEAQENEVNLGKGQVHKVCPKGVMVATVDYRLEAEGEPPEGPAWVQGSALGAGL